MATRTAAGPKVLLVEGQDDRHVISHLMEEEFWRATEIRDAGGDTKMIRKVDVRTDTDEPPKPEDSIDVWLDRPGLTHLGIVVDADNDLGARWQSLQNAFARGRVELPASPAPEGTIVTTPNRPAIGVWVMPDNQRAGMVEDYLALLIPAGDKLWPLAVNAVETVESIDRRYPVGHTAKARIHTWLAWQASPGMRMGAAVHRCASLDQAAMHAEGLRAWLRRLFADTQPESASAEAGSSA